MPFDIKKYLEESTKILRKDYETSNFSIVCDEWDTKEEMLEMRDGKKLKTISYVPKTTGNFPTIIQRTCYPHTDILYRIHAEEFCKRGYAFVYQYCRGTGGSEGEWSPNINERNDGEDTVNWLSKQNWVENIGYWGSSYLALTGWAIADIVPDKVKTMYLTLYGADRFTSAYKDGLFRHDILTAWAMDNAGFEITADYMESCKYRPHNEVDEKLWGSKTSWYRDLIGNTSRSDAYWQDGFWKTLIDIPGKVKIPLYIGEGWFDHHLGSALKTYERLSDETKKHSVLNIGSWNHGFRPCLERHETHNLQNSDVLSALNWFDKILRKKELPVGKVRTYLIGSDEWKEWGCYPFPAKGQKKMFMTAKQNGECYSIQNVDSSILQKIEYDYNPENPVASHGTESMFKTFSEVGSLLQKEPNYRDDVISFISDELEQDLEIVGKITVNLSVSSDAEDTAFSAKIMEVFPDGEAYNIRSSITTLAYRNGSDTRLAYTPNEIVTICIDMWDIAWKLQKGSKLRIDISSSDFPQYAVHSNYAGIWSEHKKTKVAKQTIYFGEEYPSFIDLPIA